MIQSRKMPLQHKANGFRLYGSHKWAPGEMVDGNQQCECFIPKNTNKRIFLQ